MVDVLVRAHWWEFDAQLNYSDFQNDGPLVLRLRT
jgi:hypothetical protein